MDGWRSTLNIKRIMLLHYFLLGACALIGALPMWFYLSGSDTSMIGERPGGFANIDFWTDQVTSGSSGGFSMMVWGILSVLLYAGMHYFLSSGTIAAIRNPQLTFSEFGGACTRYFGGLLVIAILTGLIAIPILGFFAWASVKIGNEFVLYDVVTPLLLKLAIMFPSLFYLHRVLDISRIHYVCWPDDGIPSAFLNGLWFSANYFGTLVLFGLVWLPLVLALSALNYVVSGWQPFSSYGLLFLILCATQLNLLLRIFLRAGFVANQVHFYLKAVDGSR